MLVRNDGLGKSNVRVVFVIVLGSLTFAWRNLMSDPFASMSTFRNVQMTDDNSNDINMHGYLNPKNASSNALNYNGSATSPLLMRMTNVSLHTPVQVDPTIVSWTHPAIHSTQPLIPDDQINFCENNSFVLMEHHVPPIRTENNTRLYSINRQSFQRHHDRYCETSSELLRAIELGTRSWGLDPSITDNVTLKQKESMSSYFVPYGCDIPYLNARDYCAAANTFSDIVIQGDSMSRHLHQAMIMAYRGDVIRGSIDPPLPSSPSLQQCHCDAQFSPSHKCRVIDQGLYATFQPHELGICSELPQDTSLFRQRYSVNRKVMHKFPFEGVNCSSPNYKGLLLYIQGGVHWTWNPLQFWRDIWRKVLVLPNIRDCANQHKVTLIWSGYTVQSPMLDTIYSQQSITNGLKFDETMDGIFARFNLSVPTLRWIPLTLGSMKTDGLHSMTDVNLQKAQHLMILATMLKREGKYQSIGRFA